MTTLGKAVALAVVFAVMAVVYGFTFQTLWGWFVVPQFGVAPLAFFEALGLAATIGYVTTTTHPDPDDKDRTATEVILRGIVLGLVKSGLALTFGAIYVALR